MSGLLAVIASVGAEAGADLTARLQGRVHVCIRRTRTDRLQHLGEACRPSVDSLGGRAMTSAAVSVPVIVAGAGGQGGGVGTVAGGYRWYYKGRAQSFL
jgi:hypothetical protein